MVAERRREADSWRSSRRAVRLGPGGARRNLEVVDAAFDAYGRGDMEALVKLADPTLVVSQPAEMPETQTFRGRRGFIEAIDAWAEAWDDFRLARIRTRAVGEHVVTTVHQRGRGKWSGAEVEGTFTFVFTVKAGKFVRWRMFGDEVRALEAVGLRQAAKPAAGH
jgi:ketosteroid isomerase-like protein